MPVQRADINEQRILRREPALDIDGEQRQQPEDAGRHVCTVESGQREERRAEQIRMDRQSFVHERRELERLIAEERRAERSGRSEPELRVAEQRSDVSWLAAIFDGGGRLCGRRPLPDVLPLPSPRPHGRRLRRVDHLCVAHEVIK